MKSVLILPLLAAVCHAVAINSSFSLPPVTSEGIRSFISPTNLWVGADTLQEFATAYPGYNRSMGSPGETDTIEWIYDSLVALDYYNVYKQVVYAIFSGANRFFSTNQKSHQAWPIAYAPSGSVNGLLVAAANTGCDESDYPANTRGNLLLVANDQTCSFAQQASNAMSAGAAGMVIYRTAGSGLQNASFDDPEGHFLPALQVLKQTGQLLLDEISRGPVETFFRIDTPITRNITSYNIIAETRGGDHDNVLALSAHVDSVDTGPGLNDDGSAIISMLEVAKSLSKFSVKNAVRFFFFTGEEKGLLGSQYWVDHASDPEMAKIRQMHNYELLASENWANLVPVAADIPGSEEIARTYSDFYVSQGYGYTNVSFETKAGGLRSDAGPFTPYDIPLGSISSGGDQNKTEEEAKMFGGFAGRAYDENYHYPSDDIDHLNMEAWLLNTLNIANMVSKYAMSRD